MSSQLIFYTNPMSRGRIVRWMLEEVGEAYETQVIDYPAMKSAAYLAVNPMGKVPTIRHGATVVTEATAICAYLADAFPAAQLAPALDDRGAYYRWLFFVAGPLEAALMDQRLGVEPSLEMQRTVGYGSLEHTLSALEGALTGREFIAGDRFTAADLIVASQLGFGLQFKTIEARPAFVQYSERHAARPAAVRAREIDDALIAAQKAGA